VPDRLTLDRYAGTGRQTGEEELDVDAAPGELELNIAKGDRLMAASSTPEFNAVALSQLESMGFPTVRCQKALLATGNSDAEIAMSWLFEHMEDPGESWYVPSSAYEQTSILLFNPRADRVQALVSRQRTRSR